MIDQFAVKKVLRAFERKDVGAVRTAIVEHQINPNALIPSKGVCLLHLIIGNPSENFAFQITKLFLKCGGDPNVQSSDGVTPTHVAAGWGRNRILHTLLISGGDPWIQDDEKKNAFNYAFEEQEWNTIKMLYHFQQMYSAANFKFDSINEKIRLELEKLSIEKSGKNMIYSPVNYLNKSIMTEEIYEGFNERTPPIQEKIKYFEPHNASSFENIILKSPEKLNAKRQLKKNCQASKVIIINDSIKSTENSNKKDKAFVSSLCIGSGPEKLNCLSDGDKNALAPVSDIRGRLFFELQEAVRRRSLPKFDQKISLKINSSNTNVIDTSSAEFEKSESVIILKDLSRSKQILTESSCMNLVESDAINNMSNLASRILEKTVTTEEAKIETVNLSSISSKHEDSFMDSQLDQEYSTPPLTKMQKISIPQHSLTGSSLYLTSNESIVNTTFSRGEKEGLENPSFMNFADAEEDVIIQEKKLALTPVISLTQDGETEEKIEEAQNSFSRCSMASSSPSCNSDILRYDLLSFGCDVGPITKTTKKIYLNKLLRFKKEDKQLKKTTNAITPTGNFETLNKHFRNMENLDKIKKYRFLEEQMCLSFEKGKKRQWREGTNKMSFNYLLLDPRVSLNLPTRACQMTKLEAWKCFLSAIFYIGKGKRSRPYAHLHQAAANFENGKKASKDKDALIIEIWKEGFGVICLQVFQNVMPVEAFTREAAMIDALGLPRLRNSKHGEFYGVVSTWSSREKQKLGFYLLYKAFMIFLNEGERQIKPYDI